MPDQGPFSVWRLAWRGHFDCRIASVLRPMPVWLIEHPARLFATLPEPQRWWLLCRRPRPARRRLYYQWLRLRDHDFRVQPGVDPVAPSLPDSHRTSLLEPRSWGRLSIAGADKAPPRR